MKKLSIGFLGVLAFIQFGSECAWGWDYEGHRVVNQLALASLPANFPAFVKTSAAAERLAFLGGEPDRWRNTDDNTFLHVNQPDHFMDLEYLADFGLKPETAAVFRYDFIAQLTAVRLKNPGVRPVVDPARDVNHNQMFFGFLPWAINEYYSKLKSEFSYLKTFEQNGGTPEEIRNAQENILYVMGVMGHYVGDSTQPLHTTKHFNGWEGPNPKGYSTRKTFHSWIDGGYFAKVGLDVKDLLPKVRPAREIERANSNNEGIFKPVMMFIAEQNKLVEPLYQLEKDGKLSGDGTVGQEGKSFLHGQLLKGGQMLGDIWLTAWQTAPEDSYLKGQLTKRNAAAATEKKTTAGDNQLHIGILPDGTLNLGRDYDPITVDELKSKLIAEVTKNPELQISLDADKATPFSLIVKVMDVVKAAKVKTVNMVTKEWAK